MANMAKGKFGKDHPENFIEGALRGGSGPSREIVDKKVDRPDQSIKSAYALDNVKLVEHIPTSLKDEGGFAGGLENLKHSLTGGSAVEAESPGAAGATKKTIIPNH
jgi:hypothetical protein